MSLVGFQIAFRYQMISGVHPLFTDHKTWSPNSGGVTTRVSMAEQTQQTLDSKSVSSLYCGRCAQILPTRKDYTYLSKVSMNPSQ